METETTQPEKRDASNCDALLERATELEEWLGIKLDPASIHYDRSERLITVFCEMHPTTGLKLKQNIRLLAAVYDGNGRVIAQEDRTLCKDNFYSFEIIEIHFFDITPKKLSNIQKIKVYPTKW